MRWWHSGVVLVCVASWCWAQDAPPLCEDEVSCASLCQSGDAQACKLAGDHAGPGAFSSGDEADNKRAAGHWLTGCRAGSAESCVSMARLHMPWHVDECDGTFGHAGFEMDSEIARRFFEDACALGDTASCDEVKRRDAWEKDAFDACKSGWSSRCESLGRELIQEDDFGHGPRDLQKGLTVLELGCSQLSRSSDACTMLKKTCKKKRKHAKKHPACS